jgi:hypothetical protein
MEINTVGNPKGYPHMHTAGLDWEQAQAMDEAELKQKLFPPKQPDLEQRPEPDWPQVEKGLQGKGVTRCH